MNNGVKIGVSILLIPVIMVSSGYVSSILWGWFLVPLGVPAIGAGHAYGLGVMTVWFSGGAKIIYRLRDKKDKWGESIVAYLTLPWFTLLLGYVATLFM